MLEGDGWCISDNDAGFDPNTALYRPDFIEYVSTTAPDKVEKMQKAFGANWENNLKLHLVKSLEVKGIQDTVVENGEDYDSRITQKEHDRQLVAMLFFYAHFSTQHFTIPG